MTDREEFASIINGMTKEQINALLKIWHSKIVELERSDKA